jgi:hypothetical protein
MRVGQVPLSVGFKKTFWGAVKLGYPTQSGFPIHQDLVVLAPVA